MSDAVAVLRNIVGLSGLEEQGRMNADMNADTEIDVTDAIAILRIVVGLP